MGNICTRSCGFCAVQSGVPVPLDPGEPRRVADEIQALGLSHAVITSVTRDDLPDGGARHFAATVEACREVTPATSIEVLTPDFEGREPDVATICQAAPDVFNHNLETIERLTPTVRSKASYRRSLAVLAVARRLIGKGLLKSGLMVGLGELDPEVEETLCDLRHVGCDIVTIGQYLAPSRKALPVVRFVLEETFQRYEAIGRAMGFRAVFAGPFVRSSYCADQVLQDGRASFIEAVASEDVPPETT